MTTNWPKLVKIPKEYNDGKSTKECIGRSIQILNSITPLVDLDQVLEANHTNLVEYEYSLMSES